LKANKCFRKFIERCHNQGEAIY